MTAFDPATLYPYQAIIDRPPVRWPGGARVALWVVPNIEHFHLDLFPSAPDVRNFSRRDYGNRVGIWRLMETMEKYACRGTVALNSEVGIHYPPIMKAAIELGWEFMGHGNTNSITLTGLDRDVEAAVIAETKRVIESYGQRMRGWLGPALSETWNTMNLLQEAGVEYVADWVHDDLPVEMNNGLHSIPYTLELNDMPLFNNPSISIADFQARICDTFDVLYEEGARHPRAMCIALHPFLIGAPHRIRYLDAALAHITGHRDVWLATGGEIIDAFKAQR